MNLILRSCDPKLFFWENWLSFYLVLSHQKGGQLGLCALSSLDLSWFGKSPVSRLEARCQDEATACGSQCMLGPWLALHEHGCHCTHVSLLQPSYCFLSLCQRPSWQQQEREHPANRKVSFPVLWLHIHPSNRALKLSESLQTATAPPLTFCGWRRVTLQYLRWAGLWQSTVLLIHPSSW